MRALKLSLLAAAVAIAAAALAAAMLICGGSPTTHTPPANTHADGHSHDGRDNPPRSHERPAFVRSLAVVTKAEPAPSAHPERMQALLLHGKLPSGAVTATVLTDEDCAPDAEGVSHCRNTLRLPSGRTVEVRHPHRMHDVPCMTPGEKIRLGRASNA